MEKDNQEKVTQPTSGEIDFKDKNSAILLGGPEPLATRGQVVIPDECGDSLWEDVLAQKP
ncbi:MAG: hypothetical protein EOO05_13940 [Chitinophagaceae bacterium]|nr:MAG: hypothetical protein EOO05_13940 [Chitinophagaceae bacterium]